MNVWGIVFLACAAAAVAVLAARVARRGPESRLPKCSTCSTYTGCACDRPKTRTPAEPLEKDEGI